MQTRTAIALAAVGSGVPSTLITLRRGGDLLASTRAAGSLVVPDTAAPAVQLVAGVGAHAVISSFWGALLWHALPRRHAIAWGGLAGVAIAALDLEVIARRFPAIRQLPRGAQVADHMAFGMIVGACRTVVHGRTKPAGTLAAL